MSYFQGHLEQVAIDAGHAQQGISLLDVAQLSQAISAKRQADALERIAAALDASASLSDSAIAVATTNAIAHSINRAISKAFEAPLNQYGENIGECIQGQLERGNRG